MYRNEIKYLRDEVGRLSPIESKIRENASFEFFKEMNIERVRLSFIHQIFIHIFIISLCFHQICICQFA